MFKKHNFIVALFFLPFIIFFIRLFFVINGTTELRLINKNSNLSVRGNILSKNNLTIATSRKIYKVSIDTRFLDPDKKQLFIKLFSIYSGISERKIKNIFKKQKKLGRLILAKKISSLQAKNLKLLSQKLLSLKILKHIKKHSYIIGMDIIEIGEKRYYPQKDTFTPYIGYVNKIEVNSKKASIGKNGIEKYYDEVLNNKKDGLLKGKKDILGNIILDKKAKTSIKKEAMTVKLNIDLKLQKNVEIILDKMKKELKSKEIIAAIMESGTGKIITFASSNRFNPNRITPIDMKRGRQVIRAVRFPFEPGSVIKPIAIALAIEKRKVSLNDIFDAHNKGKKNRYGKYPRGKIKIKYKTIRDDHQFEKRYITVSDIVTYSSNIGTLLIANKLSAKEFLEGFKQFGFPKKSGIDLPYEKKGRLKTYIQFRAGEDKNRLNIFKATTSFGQGMLANFVQILKAYSVFNNNGIMVTPQISYKKIPPPKIKVISKTTTNIMKNLLKNVVKKGTGKGTFIDGLEIGGKTGTAQIAERGRYQKKYISSFFGFANDKSKKYTIGVTVFEPTIKNYKYYASNSAVPTFRQIVEVMLKLNYFHKFY